MSFYEFLYGLRSKRTHLICCILQNKERKSKPRLKYSIEREIRVKAVRAPTGLAVAAWHTLPTAQDPVPGHQGHQPLPQQGRPPGHNSLPCPAQPWALLSQAHLRARSLAWPWPIPREVVPVLGLPWCLPGCPALPCQVSWVGHHRFQHGDWKSIKLQHQESQ